MSTGSPGVYGNADVFEVISEVTLPLVSNSPLSAELPNLYLTHLQGWYKKAPCLGFIDSRTSLVSARLRGSRDKELLKDALA